jgi:UDP:flavonoid glycosyltransferase YjiC (YdhE family)
LRVLLPTIGSSGDVHPVLGLGLALKARGHEVTVATNEIFSEQVRANGLGFVPLGTVEEAERIARDPDLWHPTRGLPCIVRGAILPNIRRLHAIIAGHRGPSAVVAASTLCLGARVAEEALGVPTATVHLQPSVMRSMADSGRLAFVDLGPGVPAPVKRALFWLIDVALVDRLVCPELNAFRAELGLSPVRRIFGPYIHSPRLVLGLFPDWFAPPQPDWPANLHLTGFVLHDEAGRPLPEGAEEFLGSGPRPLLVTPGSAAMDRGEFFRSTVRACAALGVRAMLVTNHTDQLPKALPAGIRAFPYLPFSRVLPRCAAIAYHGGIGTLAQAVRAGVPHLVVPNTFDQPDNGRRVERLGLGAMVGSGAYSRGRRAERAIGALLGSDATRAKCREWAPRVDNAGALERACALIEGLA